MNCIINIDFERAAALKSLEAYCGKNKSQFYSYITTVIKTINSEGDLAFTPDFVSSWDSKNPLDIMTTPPDELKDAIIKYYNKKYPSISEGIRNSTSFDKIATFGYTDVNAREWAKRLFADKMLIGDAVLFMENDKHNLANRKKYDSDYAKASFMDTLAIRLSKLTGVSDDVIYQELENNNTDYIDSLIKKHRKNVTLELQNVLALYKEFSAKATETTDLASDFIDEVCWDSRLSNIRRARVISEDEVIEEEAQQEDNSNNPEDDTDNVESTATPDTTIRILNNKLGVVTDFMVHVSPSIKSIIGCLRKTTTIGDKNNPAVLDTDNPLGIAPTLDANTVASVLYTDCIYDSPEVFVKSIRDAARRLPGMTALNDLADILDSDLNLRDECFRIFRKTSIEIEETVTRGDNVDTNIINSGVSRVATLGFKFKNAIKSTALIDATDTVKQMSAQISLSTSNLKTTDKDFDNKVRNICTKLYEAFKIYYPDIDEFSIKHYVLQNENDKGIVGNINLLLNDLNDTITGALATKYNYDSLESELAEIRLHNAAINKEIREEQNYKRRRQLIDINPFYYKSYIDRTAEKAANNLANKLVSYTLLDTPLNCRNVYGNQVSSIINNSYLTNIKDILGSKLNKYKEVKDESNLTKLVWDESSPLVQFGNHRFQTKQYDFSNILLEHRDDNGDIINQGLFYPEKDKNGNIIKYVPTDYATDLIQIRLYDGTSDIDNGVSANYANMSKGDYVGTAWRNFFRTKNEIPKIRSKAADYFMRIPSDAPKTFVVTAPRYDITKLLSKTNEAAVNEHINNLVNSISSKELEDLKNVAYSYKPITVHKEKSFLNLDSFIKHISALDDTNVVNISIPLNRQKSLKNDKTKTVKIAFQYIQNDEIDSDKNIYVMEGTYYDGVLHNSKFIGFKKDSIDSAIWQDFYTEMRKRAERLSVEEGGYDWKVNANHKIVKQLEHIFIQELTDMASAAKLLFKTTKANDEGTVFKIQFNSKGEPVLNKSDIIKSNTNHNGLSPVYHFSDKNEDGKGAIFTIDEDKNVNLTGKVFTSDRFILFDYFAKEGEHPIKNFGQDLLKQYFTFIQKVDTNPNRMLLFDKNGNVILSDEQKSAINTAMQNFILAYINHTRERMKKFGNFVENLKDIAVNTENIADFIINTHLTYVAFNDLFEGDTKYYKDTQTFLKRAKESQAGGVAYGNIDFTKPLQATRKTEVKSALDNLKFQYKAYSGTTSNYPIKQYDSFKALTVYNTTKTDKVMLNRMHDVLTDKSVMGDAVMTDNAANELLYGENGKGGYQNTTVNDAQSYITFDEWIRRITARGQLPKYKDLIDRVLDETKPLLVDDIRELIQVQKNFYYDQYYDNNLRTIRPRQIKNAEFVLVPRLIIGTELEKVAKLMNKLGIDQLNTVETSKAGQGSIFTIWDNDGHMLPDLLDDLNNVNTTYKSDIMINGAKYAEYYNYSNLYTQQETPNHINAENKAGIQLMKKIIDNINDNSPKELQDAKQEFLNIYTSNIRNSFYNLMSRFGISVDDNYNIELTDDGNIKDINYTEFFKALEDELNRLGLDSNLVDYITKTTSDIRSADTNMPNYMSLVASKFENIVQSLFNNNITRQLLPGFHAAQISGMGFRKLSEQVDKSRTSNDLDYHPQLYKNIETGEEIADRDYKKLDNAEKKKYKKSRVANYIEIRLPASNFGFDRNSAVANKIRQQALDAGRSMRQAEEEVDNMFLTQLKSANLDEIIGYRIPTEGKQSICCMKVVGFTNDAYGSTIVVPDAWVAQTGSDFDIDSVYGIQYSTKVDRYGNISRKEYITDKKQLYINYVLRHLSKNEIKELFDDAKLNQQTINEIRDKYRTGKDFNKENFIDEISTLKNESLFGFIEDAAENKNLKTYTEYEKGDVEDLNTQGARCNKLLDLMKFILTHPASLEENLSRSNFDTIKTTLKDIVSIMEQANFERAARTPYNFFDQAEYQEDAMSGARLKAISVVRDTFCSVCNTVKPNISDKNVINVFYSTKNLDKNQIKDKEKELIARFGEHNVSSSTGGFTVTHNTIGWTNDNKNVDNKILTAYSSQTTAHILDAIKSGNIPNVNEETFHIYKTIVDIGSNYKTAISFIMQPGISRIVDAYNETNSVYVESNYKDYVLKAVRSILDDLHLEYSYKDNLEALLKIVENEYSDKHNFNLSLKTIINTPLNAEEQLERLAGRGIFDTSRPVRESDDITPRELKLLYDLQTILQYNHISKFSDDIQTCARVCNPDKFGAKQTIFATRKVFDDIVESITTDRNGFSLLVDNKHFLNAVYPELETAETGEEALNTILTSSTFINNSKYKPLAAFLKYSTATSIKINKTLFRTQSDEFLDIINNSEDGFVSKMSYGNKLVEKTAKDLQNYIVNYVVFQSDFLQAPLYYNTGKGGARGFEYIGRGTPETNMTESLRVFGYGYTPTLKYRKYYEDSQGVERYTELPFTVEDVNNPTQEEVANFCLMTPAQKVLWIKKHFRDTGVFNYIDVQLFNETTTRGRRGGSQTISVREQELDIESFYKLFEEAFTNKNPLVACAAADLVKYAFFVEGYKMGIGNVSKIIKNSVLRKTGRIYGTSIIDNTEDKMKSIESIITGDTRSTILENYIRGHVETSGINLIKVSKTKDGYELIQRVGGYEKADGTIIGGLIQINGSTDVGKALASKYGITRFEKEDGTTSTNEYVRLSFSGDKILYKIRKVPFGIGKEMYFLYPLNELEPNENCEWSANPRNNKFKSSAYFERVIDKYLETLPETSSLSYNTDVMNKVMGDMASERNKYIAPNILSNTENEDVPLPERLENNPSFSEFVRKVREWYPTSMETEKPILYIASRPTSNYIRNFGQNYKQIRAISIPGVGEPHFQIQKVYAKNLIEKYTGEKDKNGRDPMTAAIEPYHKKYEGLINILRDFAKNSKSGRFVNPNIDIIYAISPTDDDITYVDDGLNSNTPDFSTILDIAIQGTGSIISRSYDINDKPAQNIARLFDNKDIYAQKDSISKNLDEAIVNIAKYLEETVNTIQRKVNAFVEDKDTDTWYPIDSVECINAVKKDPVLRREYLKLLLDARAIVDDFGLIKELDIDSEDVSVQYYLNKIKKAVETIQNMPRIANAYDKFARQYYDKITDNPLVRQGLISVLDGFYRTNWFNATFNDIQETSNPIVQIVMKNLMADIRAKDFQARKDADAFISKMNDIRKRAKAKGERFDLTKVIDDYGRLKQKYTESLLEDRNRLQKKVKDAIKNTHEGSLEHLEAELEYNEWKAKHLEQEVKPEYYEQKNALVRSMLHRDLGDMTQQEIEESGLDELPEYYSKYETARRKRAAIYRRYKGDETNPDYDRELEEINAELASLMFPNEEDNPRTWTLKHALYNYKRKLSELEQKYFKYEENYAFEEALKENQRIVKHYEMSGIPESVYVNDSRYIKAKQWINRNAEIEPDFGTNFAEIKQKLDEAYETITDGGRYYREAINKKAYSRADGEFDPRLVPDNEVAAIQKEQALEYRYQDEPSFSDRTLISNQGGDRVIYSSAFYEGMVGEEHKTSNPLWSKTVTSINKLLAPLFNQKTSEIDLIALPNKDEELYKIYGEDYVKELKEKHKKARESEINGNVAILRELRVLYNTLNEIRGGKTSEAAKKFIKENVDFTAHNERKFKEDEEYAKSLTDGALRVAIFDVIKDIDIDGNVTFNRYLYGLLKPKDESKFKDEAKTEALKTINTYKERIISPKYYDAQYQARQNLTDAEYQAWIERNHVYNPYSHRYEPINIWWESHYKTDKFNYYASGDAVSRKVRDGYYTHKEASEYIDQYDEEEFPTVEDLQNHYFEEEDFTNHNYNPNYGHAGNYKTGTGYDNNIDANSFELEAMQLIQNTLDGIIKTRDGRRRLEQGWLPARNKERPNDAMGWTRELIKIFGFVSEPVNPDDWYEDVSYSKDKPITMPMMELLKGKGYKDIPQKPKRKINQSDADYQADLETWEKDKKDIESVNKEVHKSLLDKDWENVIADFIVRAGTYNAVQENKYELFYAQQLLERYGHYITAYNKKGQKRFKKNGRNSNETEAEYLRRKDDYLIEQLNNQIRRVVYNQFKSNNNPALLKIMSMWQSVTSATYMMFNFKGGIANVTLGSTQMLGDAIAGEVLNTSDFAKAISVYGAHIGDYILHYNDDKAGSLPGAIIKFMDVVDYDEHTGVSRLTMDAYEVLRKTRDLGYTPQTAGEHAMQNTMLLALMLSHRLVPNTKEDEFGQGKYRVVNFHEYSIDARETALKSILTDEEKNNYDAYKKKLASDANDFKEYAWYQKDLTFDFAKTYLSTEKQEEFAKKIKEVNKKLEVEFNDDQKHPTLYSQLSLGEDGKLTIGKDSVLAEMDKPKENGEPSDALQLLANFKGRAISVNKYIHGVYDKSGRAQLEKTWFGSLVMQYHKHLPLGIMKRFRTEGMYSEERGTIVKGRYRSIYDFLKTPFREYKDVLGLKDKEVDALTQVQNIFKNILNVIVGYKLNYAMLPEYEKANIRRVWGDMSGVLLGILVAIITKLGFDDDDEDGLAYNLLMYEADRLSVEAAQYNPLIAYGEAKKLWASPVAAGSGVTDLLSSMKMIVQAIYEGDEFDGEYHSGRFAGEKKLKVYLERRIPIWRGIKSSFIDIKKSNKFYHIGDKILNFIPLDEIEDAVEK